MERFKALPHAEIVVVEHAKHLLFGRADSVFAEIVTQVVPAVEHGH